MGSGRRGQVEGLCLSQLSLQQEGVWSDMGKDFPVLWEETALQVLLEGGESPGQGVPPHKRGTQGSDPQETSAD